MVNREPDYGKSDFKCRFFRILLMGGDEGPLSSRFKTSLFD